MENFKNVAPLSDFDWNAFENGVTESAQSKEELEKAYDKTLGSVNENDVVEGTVIAINKREVVVNDVTYLQMHIAGKKNTDGSALIDETNKQLFDCVDMNKDGKLSVSDVTALQIHISENN